MIEANTIVVEANLEVLAVTETALTVRLWSWSRLL